MQHRAQRLGNGAVPCAQRLRHAFSAHCQVAAHLAALGNTGQAKRHGLPANHQHPFVAQDDLGQELLHHHGLLALAVQGFGDAAQVQTVVLDPKDASTAHAVERLEDDVAVLGMKAPNVGRITRHQRGADELSKLENRQFFGVIANGPRLVENLRALPLGLLEQVGGIEVLAVKWRVLAHHHAIKVFERLRPLVGRLLRGGIPIDRFTGEGDVTHKGRDWAATLPHQVAHLAHADGVATALGLAHHGKSGVLVNLEGRQRVSYK